MDTLRGEGIFADAWNKEFRILRGAVDPAGHLSSAFIEQKLDASLLRWPYFSVLRHGAVPPESAYTRSRDVIGHQRPGFPDAAAVRRLMSAGGTLKLNQLSDWHRPTRTVVEQLQAAAAVAVASYVFWTPPESRGMLPHRDASHVVALQLEGRKEWQLYAGSQQVRADAGLDVDTAHPTHTFVLEPGDVLYLPHGWPHDAVARDGDSLHLTFTLTEPTPDDLLEALGRHLLDADPDLAHRFHTTTLEQRTERVRTALLAHTRRLGDDTWAQAALTAMREVTG
ncbi:MULTISPECIES: JmjC domain-containing protein [unclassified Streptomyces]|uniref:JmjC domain-containing protein n=1 Tax=unclassified Streptomyces TaxID=2593676 RepID=UPI002E351D7D|nr:MULTISPECIES: cupin domain-containing protein [unclassified Streptomyces]